MENTSLQEIFDRFLGKITDDAYLEWTYEDTLKDMQNIFLDAVPGFEFPRFSLYNFDLEDGEYKCTLTSEEINILAILMYNTWLQRQIASVENIRMKYSGSQFKLTSQANHLQKLIALKQEAEKDSLHMQRLYRRRKQVDELGTIESNWSSVMEKSVIE